jgi:hypothetical protein
MATKGKIEITFTRTVLDGETLSFERINNDTSDVVTISCTFVDSYRAVNEEVYVGSPTATLGESEAIEYEAVFNIDHNFGGLMTISRLANVVTIELDDLDWDFQNFSTTTGATEVITLTTGPDFYLTNASLQVHPTEPCVYVDVDVTTNVQADSWGFWGDTPTPVSTNPFTVSIPRLNKKRLWAYKTGAEKINVSLEQWDESWFYFRKVLEANIFITIVPNQFSGATVSFNVAFESQLLGRPDGAINLTYSLNDVDYQSNNVFTGQTNGSYTVYIKDGLGCTTSKDYEVTDSGTKDEYFFISNVNSITFSKNETWDGLQNGVHKNEDNTLSLTEHGKKTTYEESLIFRDSDVGKVQFKSNFENHIVQVYQCDGGLTSASVTADKMSNNLNLFEKLDCTIVEPYEYQSGYAGIYFTTGNVYNEADADIGDYVLNGNLPDMAQIGVYIKLSGAVTGVYQIEDLIYDSALDKRLIIINLLYTGTPTVIKCEAYYDLLPFDVYEFELDMGDVLTHTSGQDFRVMIQASDTLFTTRNYYSEYITLVPDDTYALDNYVAIQYYNSNNRDVFYLYGITHFFRAEVLNINTIIDDEIETIKGDATSYVSESIVHTGIEIEFKEVTHRVMVKIALALSSESLFINGIGYVKSDGLTIDQIENTNLYEIKCKLLRTGKSFNTLIEDRTGQSEGYKTVYLPKVITTGTDFIKT